MKRIVGFALFWIAAGNASGTGHTRFVLPDFVYDPVRCSGILPVLLLKIEK